MHRPARDDPPAMKNPIALFSLGLALVGAAQAWDSHDVIRRLALEDMGELRALPPVPVTPLSVPVTGVNPAARFEFVGAQPGETQSPFEILVGYAMEPDWGMDQELKVSWQQRFMGGYTGLSSQGYFHMYYPAVTLHLPVPVLSMGVAPKRSEQWMQMGREAFARGDEYWGWRFTAWALHYLEDVAQPYHSTQTHRRFIRPKSLIQGTTNCTSNFHLLFERWLARRLDAEVAGGPDLGLRAAIKAGTAFELGEDQEASVKRVARASHKGFGDLAGDCIRYFGDYYLSSEKREERPEDLDKLEPGPVLDRILGVSRRYMAIAGGALRGVVGRAGPGRSPPAAADPLASSAREPPGVPWSWREEVAVSRTKLLGALAGALVAGGASAEVTGRVDFSDVPRNHWAYEAVQLCARLGIFEGFEGYEVHRDEAAEATGEAASGGAVLEGSVSTAVPGESFAPGSIRPRLLDPLAESFAREMERIQAQRQEAARLRLPPRPERPAKPGQP
jgi:hypothetical protein